MAFVQVIQAIHYSNHELFYINAHRRDMEREKITREI